MTMISRRKLLSLAAVSAVTREAGAAGHTIGLNNGTYGAKTMKTADAMRAMAEIGYDGVELALMPGWPADPAVLSEGDRKETRRLAEDLGLALPAFLEVLPIDGTAPQRAHNLERLKLAAQLGHDLCPSRSPAIETILGGKSEQWEHVKASMADELKAWARVGEEAQTTICFKPHAGHAVDTPERAVWLVKQVESRRLRAVYDYSHFYVEGLPLEESLKTLFPYTEYIAVKDSSGTADNHQFLLPGDGKTDYVSYFRLLKKLGYAGFVGIEVSAMIHQKPGYQALPTLRLCYERMAAAFSKAGVERPRRRATPSRSNA